MTWIYLVLQCFCIGAIIAATWAMICNYKTHVDLITILEMMRHRPMSGPQILKAIRGVGYDKHFRARMLLRDPYSLYDPIVRDALDNPRTEIIEVVHGVDCGGPPTVN